MKRFFRKKERIEEGEVLTAKKKSIGSIVTKVLFSLIVIFILGFFGFSFTVKEGTNAIVTSFGKVRVVHDTAGLKFKFPWPFEKVVTYDVKNKSLDSGYTETLTHDKKNVIIQTYLVWKISDANKFHASIGDMKLAEKYLNDLVANEKNGTMGKYDFTALVSSNLEEVKIQEISEEMETNVAKEAFKNYGIKVLSLKIKRVSIPSANIESVLNQMIADRQRVAAQLLAEGERDSALIISEANAEAARIIAEGMEDAAEIDAETESLVAAKYGDAYDANSELFIFLKKLIALENSVDPNTVFIVKGNEPPFDVIGDMGSSTGGAEGGGSP